MKILVVAPHPDDETLGCGGTLLKHSARGDDVYWVIMTHMTSELGYTNDQIAVRQREIKAVCEAYRCKEIFELGYPATILDTLPKREVISKLADVIQRVVPEVVYLPNRSDIHSDHRVAFEACAGALKTFRVPSVKRVLAYEVLSETEFSYPFQDEVFVPNYFSNISDYLDQKISIMEYYKGELGIHPFPRSRENIRALATLRGATAGVRYAEAFMLLKEII